MIVCLRCLGSFEGAFKQIFLGMGTSKLERTFQKAQGPSNKKGAFELTGGFEFRERLSDLTYNTGFVRRSSAGTAFISTPCST